jgi:kynurenine formamidase
MPNFDSAPPYSMIPHYRLGDFELADGYWGCNEFVAMSGHSGTHLDALGHVAKDRKVYGGTAAEDAQDGVRGLVVNSIDAVDPIAARGVFIDAARIKGVDALEPAEPVDVGILEAAVRSAGIELAERDCVLVRTGWSKWWNDPVTYLGATDGTPGLDLKAAHWLADNGAFLLGADTGTVELTRPGGLGRLPVHLAMLAERGVHLLENMALDLLAERGAVSEFLFVCAPLRLVGASGSPVRPIALFQ